jgi:KDO2-lipid IV(A) lauroyltransferase
VKLRHYWEAALVWLLLLVFGGLPLDAASAFGGWLARWLGPLTPSHRVARRNLHRVMPELSAAEHRRILRDMWDNLGRTIGEYPHLAQIGRERIEAVGMERLEVVRQSGSPGYFISAHIANWEVMLVLAAQSGMPLTGVYRAPNNPLVDRMLRRLREPTGGLMLPKGSAGARQVLKVLAKGGHLGLLLDQKMNDGIAVPFFGLPAMTAPALAAFAQRFPGPIIPTQAIRLKGARFRVILHPPVTLQDQQGRQADTLTLMTEINRQIESWVREHPAQWLWIHRRWGRE